ncbi:hypothetical protein H0H93_000612 [Arthromyces matolae]|nr:hypothetical protein H0H93_000612 [Arthromyces matolae]
MATQCWNHAQENVGSDVNYELTHCMIRLVKRRGSRIRNDLLKYVRAEVQSAFSFRKNTKYMKRNAKRAQDLIANKSFHYKKPKHQEGYCENPVISSILTAIWFKDAKSAGVIYEKHFDPISINLLTFILTLVHFGISEWTTGQFKSKVFSETDIASTFEAFYTDLKRWHNLNPTVTTNRRKKLFTRARKLLGAVSPDEPAPMLVGEVEEKARQELEAHTGETDSEPEAGLSTDSDDE